MTALYVNEVFWSLQGEGSLVGIPSVFVRLQGCEVGCPWCDTGYAATLAPELRLPDNDPAVLRKPAASPRYTLATLEWLTAAVLERTPSGWHAVVTGGEPCRQDLRGLTAALLRAGLSVQVETSGTCPIACAAGTWVTLSPKHRPVLEENWLRASEIKLPVREPADVARYAARLEALPGRNILLQPVSNEPEAMALCVRCCMEHNWRLSFQAHKMLGWR